MANTGLIGVPVTPARFLGGLILASLLFFLLLVVFAIAGLGPLGLAPALVVAVTLTARITKIRRMSALIALGVLAFVIVVVMTYAVAVAVILSAGATPA